MKIKKIKDLEKYFKDIDWDIHINKENLDLEHDIEILYYWYDHLTRMIEPKLIEKIETALDNHNFKRFIKIKEYIQDNNIMITLPEEAILWDKTADNHLGSIILNKDIFNSITHHEFECG